MIRVRVTAILQKLQAPCKQGFISGLGTAVSCVTKIVRHFLYSILCKKIPDCIGGCVLRLVIVKAAVGSRITVGEDRFQPVQNGWGIILRSVRCVISVSVGTFQTHLQTVGRLAGFNNRVRRCTEIAPITIVVFLKVHKRLIGGGNMYVIGKGGYG